MSKASKGSPASPTIGCLKSEQDGRVAAIGHRLYAFEHRVSDLSSHAISSSLMISCAISASHQSTSAKEATTPLLDAIAPSFSSLMFVTRFTAQNLPLS